MRIDYSLYLVTDSELARGRRLVDLVGAAIDGGATMVQYREKGRRRARWSKRPAPSAASAARAGSPSSSTTGSTSPSPSTRTGSTWARTTCLPPSRAASWARQDPRRIGRERPGSGERRGRRGGLCGSQPDLRHADEGGRAAADGDRGPARSRRRRASPHRRDRGHQRRERSCSPRGGRGGSRRRFCHRLRGRARVGGARSAKNNRRSEDE